jgi:hypothetical protein
VQTVNSLIDSVFQEVKNGRTSISDFILISKQNEAQRLAFLACFDTEYISETLLNQLQALDKNLKIVAKLETFFNNYGTKIDLAEEYVGFIKETKQGYKNTQSDLLELYEEIENVNKWTETVMFKNIFDLEY